MSGMQKILNLVRQIMNVDPGVRACLLLHEHLQLRKYEAICSVPSLRTWQTLIESGTREIRVVAGTKAGRPRTVYIQDPAAALLAIKEAIKVSDARNGQLLNNRLSLALTEKKGGLK